MTTYLPLLFIILAGMFKAVSDTLTHHFATSIFKDMDVKFWDPMISWQYAGFLPLTKFRVDAWHISNSGMIISFCFAVVLHQPITHWFWEWLIAGTVFNLAFNIFYNKILRK